MYMQTEAAKVNDEIGLPQPEIPKDVPRYPQKNDYKKVKLETFYNKPQKKSSKEFAKKRRKSTEIGTEFTYDNLKSKHRNGCCECTIFDTCGPACPLIVSLVFIVLIIAGVFIASKYL